MLLLVVAILYSAFPLLSFGCTRLPGNQTMVLSAAEMSLLEGYALSGDVGSIEKLLQKRSYLFLLDFTIN